MSKKTRQERVETPKKEKGPATTPGIQIEVSPGVFTTRAQVLKLARGYIKTQIDDPLFYDPHLAITPVQKRCVQTLVCDALKAAGFDPDHQKLNLQNLLALEISTHATRRRNQTLTQEDQARAAERKRINIEKSRAGMIRAAAERKARAEQKRAGRGGGKRPVVDVERLEAMDAQTQEQALPKLTLKSTPRQEVRQITVVVKKARSFHYPRDLNVPTGD